MTRKNFTLLEIILAMMLLLLIAGLTGGILFTTHKTWEIIQDSSSYLEKIQCIDRIANTAFRNMIPFHWQDNMHKKREIFKGDPDSILFAYLHRAIGENATGIRFLQITLESNQIVARYRSTPILFFQEEIATSNIKEEVLIDNVKSLQFEYADKKDNEIIWYSDWDEEKELYIPIAIMMTIEFKNGQTEYWLRRTAGSSFESTFGKRKNIK